MNRDILIPGALYQLNYGVGFCRLLEDGFIYTNFIEENEIIVFLFSVKDEYYTDINILYKSNIWRKTFFYEDDLELLFTKMLRAPTNEN